MKIIDVLRNTLDELDNGDIDGDRVKTLLWAGRLTELAGQLAYVTISKIAIELLDERDDA